VAAASGVLSPIHLTVHINGSVPDGWTHGMLQVVDPAAGGQPVAAQPVSLHVVSPGPWYERYRLLLILAATLLAALLLAALARLRLWWIGARMSDIDLLLFNDTGYRLDQLAAPDGRPRRFHFAVNRASPGDGRLAHDFDGGGYIARRKGYGLRVAVPGGDPLVLSLDAPVSLGDGLQLGYLDHRLDSVDGDGEYWSEQEPDDRQPRRGLWTALRGATRRSVDADVEDPDDGSA
jgi:hypothetical protein